VPRHSAARQLWVGASISVLLTGNMPGTIDNQSPTVQPVITPTDAATWSWELDPNEAGTFALTLSVAPLLADTGVPLVAGVPYPIRLTVTESTGQQITHAVGSSGTFIRHLAEVLGALGLTVAGIAAWIVQHVRKRKKNAEQPASEPTPAAIQSDAAAPGPTTAGITIWLLRHPRKRQKRDP
jgi:hypothetical protein